MCGLFQLEGAENVSQNLVDLSQSQATATAAVGTMELQQENRISGGLQSAVLTESQAHPEILPNSTGSYDEPSRYTSSVPSQSQAISSVQLWLSEYLLQNRYWPS